LNQGRRNHHLRGKIERKDKEKGKGAGKKERKKAAPVNERKKKRIKNSEVLASF
jgi:hypothetical protein